MKPGNCSDGVKRNAVHQTHVEGQYPEVRGPFVVVRDHQMPRPPAQAVVTGWQFAWRSQPDQGQRILGG